MDHPPTTASKHPASEYSAATVALPSSATSRKRSRFGPASGFVATLLQVAHRATTPHHHPTTTTSAAGSTPKEPSSRKAGTTPTRSSQRSISFRRRTNSGRFSRQSTSSSISSSSSIRSTRASSSVAVEGFGLGDAHAPPLLRVKASSSAGTRPAGVGGQEGVRVVRDMRMILQADG